MRRKLLLNLILSLTFGTIILPSISGCANNETQEEKTIIELNYDKSLGSVTASKTECQPGETITLEIKPNAGYEISLVKINGIKAEISESISFTAQKGKNEIIVAFYKPYVDPTVDNSYQILTNYDTTKGEVRASPVKGSNYLETFVNVSVKPYGGNEVSSILVNDVEFSKENLEFTFKPVKGDNLVKVEFEGGNIIEEFENFNIDLVYNEKYGTINLENTSGYTDGTKEVTFNVVPNEGYEVEGVYFNGSQLELTSINEYKITPIRGTNTLFVTFNMLVKPIRYFEIALEYDESLGSASVDKTEGEVGEEVTLTIEPNKNFQTNYIYIPSDYNQISDNLYKIYPNEGENIISIGFSEAPFDPLAEFEKGYEIDAVPYPDSGNRISYADYLNTVNEVFGMNYDASLTNNSYFACDFYDCVISKIDMPLESLKTVVSCFSYLFASSSYEGNYFAGAISNLSSSVPENLFNQIMYYYLNWQMLYIINSIDALYKDSKMLKTYYENEGNFEAANYFGSFINPNIESGSMKLPSSNVSENNLFKFSKISYDFTRLLFDNFTMEDLKKFENPDNYKLSRSNLKVIFKIINDILPGYDSFLSLLKDENLGVIIGYCLKICGFYISFDALKETFSFFDTKDENDIKSFYYSLKVLSNYVVNDTHSDGILTFISDLINNSLNINKSEYYLRSFLELKNSSNFQLLMQNDDFFVKFVDGFEIILNILAKVIFNVIPNNYNMFYNSYNFANIDVIEFGIAELFSLAEDLQGLVGEEQNMDSIKNYFEDYISNLTDTLKNFEKNNNEVQLYYYGDVISFSLNSDPLSHFLISMDESLKSLYSVVGVDTTYVHSGIGFLYYKGFEVSQFYYVVNNSPYYSLTIPDKFKNLLSYSYIWPISSLYSQTLCFNRSRISINDLENIDLIFGSGFNSEYYTISLGQFNLDLSTTGLKSAFLEFEGVYLYIVYFVYEDEQIINGKIYTPGNYLYEEQNVEDLMISNLTITIVFEDEFFGERFIYLDFNSIDSLTELDTSKPGLTTMTFKDTNGNNFLTKVYVSEVITKEYCLENKSFYQFVPVDDELYYYGYEMIVIQNEFSIECSIKTESYAFNLNKTDFSNHLDTSIAGKVQTTYFDQTSNKTFKFEYYVNELLSGDREPKYYVNTPYDYNSGMFLEDYVDVYYGIRGLYRDASGRLTKKVKVIEQFYFTQESFNDFNPSYSDVGSTVVFKSTLNSYFGNPVDIYIDVVETTSFEKDIPSYIYVEIIQEEDAFLYFPSFVQNQDIGIDYPYDIYIGVDSYVYEYINLDGGLIDGHFYNYTYIPSTTLVSAIDLTTPGVKENYINYNEKEYVLKYDVIECVKIEENSEIVIEDSYNLGAFVVELEIQEEGDYTFEYNNAADFVFYDALKNSDDNLLPDYDRVWSDPDSGKEFKIYHLQKGTYSIFILFDDPEKTCSFKYFKS